jgi:adenylate cyclase
MSAVAGVQVLPNSGASPAVLGSVVVGRFDVPREERRIVTFIDLVGSTGIAERLGSVRFHAFLSEVFTRLSEVVGEFGGEVHRYVGDTLIATWPLGSTAKNARAILALFACRAALEGASADFRSRFGEAPEFRASLHCGPLVAAQIGTIKGEIALVGDAMNTAARMEQVARATGHRLLVSRALLMHAALPFDAVATRVGARRLRGKSERTELFALEQRAVGEGHLSLFRACA